MEIKESRSGLAATIEQTPSSGTLEAIAVIRDEELRQMRENLGRVERLLTGGVDGDYRKGTGVALTKHRNEERSWGKRGGRFEVEPVVSHSQRCFEDAIGLSDADLIHGEIAEMIDIHEASIRAVYQAIVLDVASVEDVSGQANG